MEWLSKKYRILWSADQSLVLWFSVVCYSVVIWLWHTPKWYVQLVAQFKSELY